LKYTGILIRITNEFYIDVECLITWWLLLKVRGSSNQPYNQDEFQKCNGSNGNVFFIHAGLVIIIYIKIIDEL